MVGTIHIQIRLPRDIVAEIDQDIIEGSFSSRTDYIYRAVLYYQNRQELRKEFLVDIGEEFEKKLIERLYSPQNKLFLREIVLEEIVSRNHYS